MKGFLGKQVIKTGGKHYYLSCFCEAYCSLLASSVCNSCFFLRGELFATIFGSGKQPCSMSTAISTVSTDAQALFTVSGKLVTFRYQTQTCSTQQILQLPKSQADNAVHICLHYQQPHSKHVVKDGQCNMVLRTVTAIQRIPTRHNHYGSNTPPLQSADLIATA